MRVPDPYWKTNPDWVAEMSYQERYLDEIDDGPDEEDDDWADSIFARNNKGGF